MGLSTIGEMKADLEKSGVLVFDAHKYGFDMVRTVMYLRFQFPRVRIVVPVAGYLFYSPLWRGLLRVWNWLLRIEGYPVYRKVDESTRNLMIRRGMSFVPSEVTPEKKRAANSHFLQKAQQAIVEKHTLVVVAPYKGPVWFGEEIAKGASILAEQARSVYLSYSSRKMLSATRIVKFHPRSTTNDDTYAEILQHEFGELLAGE